MREGKAPQERVPWALRVLPPELRAEAPRIWRLLFLAYGLRVFLMPLFASQDAMTTIWISLTLMDRRELILSNDPAPVFYLHAGIFALFRPLVPDGFLAYFAESPAYSPAINLQIHALSQDGINVVITLLKLPYLLFDFGIALLLLWVVEDSKAGRAPLLLWAFNPVAIYVSYFIGQFDVIPVFFTTLAFYYYKKGQNAGCWAALAVAIVFKIFAALLVPLFLIAYFKRASGLPAKLSTFARAGMSLALPLMVLVGIYLVQPIYYESANIALRGDLVNGYFATTLFNRGIASHPVLAGLATFAGFSTGVATSTALPDVIVILATGYGLLLLFTTQLVKISYRQLLSVTVVLFFLIYGLSGFHAQWFLWVQPFLVIFVARDRKFLMPYALLIILFFVYVAYWDEALLTQPITPILPAAADWPGPLTILSQGGFPALVVLNLARSLFSAVCFFMIYLNLRDHVRFQILARS